MAPTVSAACYTAGGDGDTTGNSHVGGFAGTLSGSANCDNCFRLVDGLADVGSEESGGGYNGTIVALDAAEMRSTNNFTAFQAAGCWTQTDGQTQPYFDWGLVDGKFLLLAGDTATTTVNGLGAYAPGTDVPISINPTDSIFLGWTGGATYANASANETTVLLDNYHVVSVTLGTRITTRAQLAAISSNLSGAYGLAADIDLSGSPWTPIGSLGSPFTGKLYGHGHKIIGLTFDNTSSGDSAGARVGIFRSVDGATIDGVHLEGVSIKGYERCGALAGEVHGTSTIRNCSAQGSVSGNWRSLRRLRDHRLRLRRRRGRRRLRGHRQRRFGDLHRLPRVRGRHQRRRQRLPRRFHLRDLRHRLVHLHALYRRGHRLRVQGRT